MVFVIPNCISSTIRGLPDRATKFYLNVRIVRLHSSSTWKNVYQAFEATMLLDLLTAIKALGHLVSLGVLNDPTRTGEPSSLSVASARNTVDTQISAVCGDIFTEANNGKISCIANVSSNVYSILTMA